MAGDAIFQPDGHDKTFAEMTADEKNAISHRRQVASKLKEFFKVTDMLDMKLIRDNADQVKKAILDKNVDLDIEQLL